MPIEIGDRVRLTTEAVMMLAKVRPETFNQLLASGALEGRVVDIFENRIMVDIENINPSPLEIETEVINQHRVLQIIEKSAARGAVAPPVQHMPPIQFGDEEEFETPLELSKWVILQFLQLKQHGISQDLMRTPDYLAKPPEPHDQQTWETDGVSYRPVKVELSAAEDQLYNTALRHLKLWLSGRTVAPQHPECNSAPNNESGT